MDKAKTPPAVLPGTELLGGLSPAVVQDFMDRTTRQRLPAGGVVYEEGEPSERVFLIVSGRVKVLRRGEHGDNVLVIVGPGELLGDLSIFEPTVQPVTAIALTAVEMVTLPSESMREWLGKSPGALRSYVQVLHLRIRQAIDAHNDMYGLDVGARVAGAILREAQRFGRSTADGVRVTSGLTHGELALHVRASRERVTRVIGGFTRQGWIRKEGGDLVVLDEAQLMRRAGMIRAPAPDADATS